MIRWIPQNIPKIRLSEPPKLSISKMRNQSSLGRITTAEAFSYVMKELNEDQDSINSLLLNLNLRCNAILKSKGYDESKSSLENRERLEKSNVEKKKKKMAEEKN